MIPRPFLKWCGGKTQLLPELILRAPLSYGTYREPFLGGGALFFALKPKLAVLSDINAELIATYQAVRDVPLTVIEILKDFQERYSSEHYYIVRSMPNGVPAYVAARMIYLNKTCFNGLYRVNKKGEFNASFGRYTDPKICDEENLLECSQALQGVELRVMDFREALATVGGDDFVYCDPPYYGTFSGYSKGGFSLADQRELAQLCDCKRCLITNADTPETRTLYKGFFVDTVEERRSVNRSAKGRGKVSTLIVEGAK
jgi:DNA adenine methylase